ncbi:unnamed protein product, partial [Prorocentrum cordatum]
RGRGDAARPRGHQEQASAAGGGGHLLRRERQRAHGAPDAPGALRRPGRAGRRVHQRHAAHRPPQGAADARCPRQQHGPGGRPRRRGRAAALHAGRGRAAGRRRPDGRGQRRRGRGGGRRRHARGGAVAAQHAARLGGLPAHARRRGGRQRGRGRQGPGGAAADRAGAVPAVQAVSEAVAAQTEGWRDRPRDCEHLVRDSRPLQQVALQSG